MSLYENAKEIVSDDPRTKPYSFYRQYDEYFGETKLQNIVEVGVYKGDSVKVLSKTYPDARILALDLQHRDIDFQGYGNISYVKCNQTDKEELHLLVCNNFPEGVDLVIDDASHVGAYSLITFLTLFPLLKPGGTYIVEDWGTGYVSVWPDGSEYNANVLKKNDPKVDTHTMGMVGFVKSLVDMSHGRVAKYLSSNPSALAPIAKLILSNGIVIMKKTESPLAATVSPELYYRLTD